MTTPAPEVLWYIIPREGAYPWEPEGRRPVDLGYLQHLAGTVERLGYTGALLATDLYDVWPLGSALAAATSTRFKPLLAVHPGLISPTLLAKTALTFEYPSAEGDPYYPVPKPENQEPVSYTHLTLPTKA